MSDPFDSNLIRIIQEGETDADSPLSEELMSQIRENLEALMILGYYTGDARTASADPPDDATGVLTHAGAAFTVDEHNGRSLVIIDGNGAGGIYTIDDTAAQTVTCTGDNLYSDGVRSGDAFKIFYNLKNTLAHKHDGVDSSKEQMCHIKVGTYTGDGGSAGAAQAITGVGFEPQAVIVSSAADNSTKSVFMRFDGLAANYCIDISLGYLQQFGINSLDADGFTVDDLATDQYPNKNGHGFAYLAWG